MNAIKLVKAIGLLNLFGNAAFKMNREQMAAYAKLALGIEDATHLLKQQEQYKIIRYASYKFRYILFDGTDINIEDEIRKAGLVVSRRSTMWMTSEIIVSRRLRQPRHAIFKRVRQDISSTKYLAKEWIKYLWEILMDISS